LSPGAPDTLTRSQSGGELACASWRALGTSVVLRVTDPRALVAARAHVERELDAIDRACSRFRADSELTRVNESAGRFRQVSELLAQALELALRAAVVTDGAVDPTIGCALELAGYDRDWQELPHPSCEAGLPGAGDAPHGGAPVGGAPVGGAARTPAITLRRRSSWRAIALDRVHARVRIPGGIRLDLGATAKGWAADRAAQAAARAADCGALVSIGGDIATAGRSPAGGWRIRVTDDHHSPPTAPGQTIAVHSGGLATSSTTVRRWRHEGRTMHHIIDPATGEPARTRWRTVSVAAATCAEANIATTAALVKGDAATDWLAVQGLPARLVDNDGVVLCINGWPRSPG